MIKGAVLEIDPDQAQITNKISLLYASGPSIRGVAKALKADKVPSPQPREGRQQSWSPSAVRVILRNSRSRGAPVLGKSRKVRTRARAGEFTGPGRRPNGSTSRCLSSASCPSHCGWRSKSAWPT